MSAHWPSSRAMLVSSSLNAFCLANRACPQEHEEACLPSLSRSPPHSDPSGFPLLHRDPVAHTGRHSRSLAVCWIKGGVGDGELEE